MLSMAKRDMGVRNLKEEGIFFLRGEGGHLVKPSKRLEAGSLGAKIFQNFHKNNAF